MTVVLRRETAATEGWPRFFSSSRTRWWQRQPKAAAATAVRRGWTDVDGGELRVDGVGGAPVICGGNGGRDEDGGDLAILMKETATDGDDRSDGGARLDTRRRQRRKEPREGDAREGIEL
uniref:DUF834 domain-containing protein n=1 Tax=Oryza sativa subsp. japonica TaxID=39947 RepID=Q75M83_ORYSJ|nr:hypothetical protein [Oryza sativa Japonica Group]